MKLKWPLRKRKVKEDMGRLHRKPLLHFFLKLPVRGTSESL
jgi:hypothetical protein